MSMIAGLISYLRGNEKKTAIIAKERLQIILAHERAGRGAPTPDYLPEVTTITLDTFIFLNKIRCILPVNEDAEKFLQLSKGWMIKSERSRCT